MLGWFWFLIAYAETRRIKSAVLGGSCLGIGFLQLHRLVGDDADLPRPVGDRVLACAGTAVGCGRSWRRRSASSLPLLCSCRGSGRTRRCCARPRSLPDVGPGTGVADPGAAQRRSSRQAGGTVSTYLSHFDPGVPVRERRTEHDDVDGPRSACSCCRWRCCCRSVCLTLLRRPDPFGFHAVHPAGGGDRADCRRRSRGSRSWSSARLHVSVCRADCRLRLRLAVAVALAGRAPRRSRSLVGRRRCSSRRSIAITSRTTSSARRSITIRWRFRDVAAYLIADEPAPLIYFSHDIDDAGAKWRFYTTRTGART